LGRKQTNTSLVVALGHHLAAGFSFAFPKHFARKEIIISFANLRREL
jgi:hypothetical protein